MEQLERGSRRLTQVAVQKLILPHKSAPAGRPAVPVDLLTSEPTPACAQLTPFVSLACGTAALSPTCMHCQRGMSWDHWCADAVQLPVGRGLYGGRCLACQSRDAVFKDGSSR